MTKLFLRRTTSTVGIKCHRCFVSHVHRVRINYTFARDCRILTDFIHSFTVKLITKFAISVLFLSRPRSKGWPYHERTFAIYLCPLSTLISCCSPNHHLYADETQLPASFRQLPTNPSNSSPVSDTSIESIDYSTHYFHSRLENVSANPSHHRLLFFLRTDSTDSSDFYR